MCGRYAMELAPDELQRLIEKHGFQCDGMKDEELVTRSLNVAPQTYSMVLCREKDKHELCAMKWTLQPSFAKEPVKFSSFNTRSESLDPLRSAWRSAKYRRGILFMQGYYEWQYDKSTKERNPYYMHSPKQELLYCMVIWDMNEKLVKMPTYSIITKPATDDLASIHERMPVVTTDIEAAKTWIDGDWPQVLKVVDPPEKLENYRVSRDVNKVGVNKPGLNKPLKEAKVTEWFSPQKKRVKEEDSVPDKKIKKETPDQSEESSKNLAKKSPE